MKNDLSDNNNARLFQAAKYALTDLPGQYGYTRCLQILSRVAESKNSPDEGAPAREPIVTPLNASNQIDAPLWKTLDSAIDQFIQWLEEQKEEQNKNKETKNKAQSDQEKAAYDAVVKEKQIRHTISGWWSYFCSLSWLTKRTPFSDNPHHKALILRSCWSFGQQPSANKNKKDGGEKKAASAPSPDLNLEIERATQSIKNQRSLYRDTWHWISAFTAAFYAIGCGMTIAGAMLMLIGATPAVIGISVAFGLVSTWINWRNCRRRVPEVIDEFFFMPSKVSKWLPGMFQYVDEADNAFKPIIEPKHRAIAWAGFACSLAVGLAIAALTWQFSMHLATVLGFAGAAFFPPLLIIVLVVTVYAEWALQLKSFIDVCISTKFTTRCQTFKQAFMKASWLEKAITSFFLFLFGAVAIVGLVFLSMAGQTAIQWGIRHIPNVLSLATLIVSCVVAVCHFFGTLPYNVEMALLATRATLGLKWSDFSFQALGTNLLKLTNAIGNAVVVLTEGIFGMTTAGLMSWISSFAGDASEQATAEVDAKQFQADFLTEKGLSTANGYGSGGSGNSPSKSIN